MTPNKKERNEMDAQIEFIYQDLVRKGTLWGPGGVGVVGLLLTTYKYQFENVTSNKSH